MTTQVAIRMNDQQLGDLDWIVVRCDFENRAEALRAALAAFVKREREREIDEQMIASYTAMPQTDDELAWSEAASRRGFPGLPDEDWSDWL
jgi:metal-responsive CopG/Arc/MetJ family transcriptional regulator